MSNVDADLWVRLQEQFHALVDATPAERNARVAVLEASDPRLAQELRALLTADAKSEQLDTLTRRMSGAVQQLAGELEIETARPAWIGDYRITGTLGSGGMGVVYLAEQESPRRTVALKVIRAFGGGNAVRRFQREAQLHGRLQHPGIALIYEAGLAAERDASGAAYGPPRPFFAMEYVRGEPVNSYVQSRHLETAQRVEIMAKICDAIEHAHSRHVIHRDLKSANVLVDEAGSPKVLDFGIARAIDHDHVTTMHTAVGAVMGTLPYMSPEQVSGRSEDTAPQSDIYALGVVFFEMLTGRRPLELSGRSLAEAARIVTNDEPTRLGSVDRALRGDLETIVGRCLEKESARRYATAGAMAADLRRFLEHRPIEARPASTIYQISKFTRRHRPLVVGTLTAFAALLTATIVSITMMLKAEKASADLADQLNSTKIESARSQQSYSFLSRLLTAADPTLPGSRGGELTVHDLVLKGADALEHGNSDEAQVTGQLSGLVGYTLFKLGDLEAAERAMRRSVDLLRKPDPYAYQQEYKLGIGLNILGDVLCARGKYEEALETLQEALRLREAEVHAAAETGAAGTHSAALSGGAASPDITDPHVSTMLNSIGTVQFAMGRLQDAYRSHTRALAMVQRLVDAGDTRLPALAILTVNLAKVQLQLCETQAAIDGTRRGLEIMTRSDGDESFFTQSLRTNLAFALVQAGQYDEATQLAQQALKVRRRLTPVGHHETSICELALADAFAAQGEYAMAEPLARNAAANLQAVLGERNVNTWRAWQTLANALDAAGELEEADLAAQTLASTLEALFQDTHYRSAEAYATLSSIARHRGHWEEAAALAERAAQIARATLKPEHPAAIRASRELALAHEEIDNSRTQAVERAK